MVQAPFPLSPELWLDDGRPLIEPPAPSLIIADPSFLFPEESPDGLWRLVAHDAFGLLSYISPDGLAWRREGRICWNAMRAFIRKLPDGHFILCYEAYRPLALPLQLLPRRPRWRSRIMARFSSDARKWGRPVELVRPCLPWHSDPRLGDSVSNPCLVADPAGGWRLYYSASLAYVPDCGFDEPKHIGMARAERPEGPWRLEPEPILSPVAGSGSGGEGAGDLGEGSIKAFWLGEEWIGLQNKISLDASGRSASAIRVLRSSDGLRWEPAMDEPLLAPSEGWRASHVYACDCRFREADSTWYLYYNARDEAAKGKGRERIGRLLAPASPRGLL